MVEVSFPNIAGFLADLIAERFPTFSVGLEWPSNRVNAKKWVFVRSDGIVKDSVVTGDFAGAVIVKGESDEESVEVARQILVEILRQQYVIGSPITVVHRQVEPYLVSDATHGAVATLPVSCGVMGEELSIRK